MAEGLEARFRAGDNLADSPEVVRRLEVTPQTVDGSILSSYIECEPTRTLNVKRIDMSRKSDATVTTSNSTAASRTSNSLRILRERVDKLDLQILKFINDRASVAVEIGKLKAEQGGEIFSPAREEEVLKNVLEVNTKHEGPLNDVTIRAVFREIMSGSRALQKVLKVAFLGPEYSFSHLAAVERFGLSIEFMGVGSIAAVFEEVDRGHVDFGVVPVENSSDGRI